MEVKLIKSPKATKKFRVILSNGKKVDFGGAEYSDFTKHKDASRMRRYVRRHGGIIKKSILEITNPDKIMKEMEKVNKSTKEDWSKKGIHTAGFWSRWYLWSYPEQYMIKKLLKRKFGIILRT